MCTTKQSPQGVLLSYPSAVQLQGQLTSCKSFSRSPVSLLPDNSSPVAPRALAFSSPSRTFLGKFWFLQVYCFSILTTRERREYKCFFRIYSFPLGRPVTVVESYLRAWEAWVRDPMLGDEISDMLLWKSTISYFAWNLLLISICYIKPLMTKFFSFLLCQHLKCVWGACYTLPMLRFFQIKVQNRLEEKSKCIF